jgi:transposase InsO family protein
VPPRAPKVNAFAQRWVRSLRTECLARTLIWTRRHLEQVLADYVGLYNTARPRRGIRLGVPAAESERGPARRRRFDVSNGSTSGVDLSINPFAA